MVSMGLSYDAGPISRGRAAGVASYPLDLGAVAHRQFGTAAFQARTVGFGLIPHVIFPR